MIMNPKVSCIIPAYNEEQRISAVLNIVKDHPLIEEIIVVNDGSKDNTHKIVESFSGIKLISYAQNRGKTYALLRGNKESRNELIMFLDSDLNGLSKEDLTDLINPILNNQAEISLSLRKNSLLIFRALGLDFVSGERVLNKNLLPDFDAMLNLPGFGFESFLNRIIIEKKLRLKIVKWNKVSHARKSEKVGLIKGTFGDISMIKNIIQTIGLKGIFYQIIKMRSLKV